MEEIKMRYANMINGELIIALELCAQLSALPGSNQIAHPITDIEFRDRLLLIGKTARTALANSALANSGSSK